MLIITTGINNRLCSDKAVYAIQTGSYHASGFNEYMQRSTFTVTFCFVLFQYKPNVELKRCIKLRKNETKKKMSNKRNSHLSLKKLINLFNFDLYIHVANHVKRPKDALATEGFPIVGVRGYVV